MIATLSEAIREGAKLAPQAFGGLIVTPLLREVLEGPMGATCALGAAMQAVGINPDEPFGRAYDDLMKVYPYCGVKTYIPCEQLPDCPLGDGYEEHTLTDFVAHLNDHHHWSREQIADWVEKYEEKLGFVHLVETEQEATAQDAPQFALRAHHVEQSSP